MKSFRIKFKKLEERVKKGEVICSKHDKVLSLGIYYGKKCYVGRKGRPCRYIRFDKQNE